MATLYVRDVPEDLYQRLRDEAAASRRSLAAETVELLSRSLPAGDRTSLDDLLATAERIRAKSALPNDAPSAAELIRRDRER